MLPLSLVALAGGCNGRFDFDYKSVNGGDGSPPGDALAQPDQPALCSAQSQSCPCSGTVCSCDPQRWCRFAGAGCARGAGECGLLCREAGRCEGMCLDNCRLECEHDSTCTLTMGDNASVEAERSELTVTVGTMSKVHCEQNALCHVTCRGACVLECQSGSHCDLLCPGDIAPRSADTGGSCP